MSARGGRVAFVGSRGTKRHVVVDGVESAPCAAVELPVALSPDGRRVAFSAGRFVVIDGEKGPEFDATRAPLFSPDARRVAYAAQRSGAWTVVVDGRPGRFFDAVSDPVLSGDRVAYSTGFRIVWNEDVLGPYEAVTPPALSADGQVLAFGRRSKGRWTVELGGRSHPVEGELERVFLSPDGSRFGVVILRDGKYAVEGELYDEVGTPLFSSDGRAWACAVRRGAERFMLFDGRRLGPFGDVGPPVFGERRLSFGARRGRELLWATVER